MKLEYLREFLDLAQTMNYSASASRLFISQSTLSRHIQAMEKELGYSLFITSSHGIELTKSGEVAIASFRRIVREYDRFLEKSANLSQQISGTIRIGLLYYAMDDFFADFLEHLENKYPNVTFTITTDQPQPLADKLASGAIDISSLMFYNLRKHKDLHLIPIGSQKSIAMMRNDHPLSVKGAVTLEELSFSDLIELKNDEYSTEITRELLEMHHIHFAHTLMTDNIETVPMLIRKTGAIHLTGESCKRQNASGICYKEVSGRNTHSQICLAALPDNDNPLIEIVYREAAEFFK